MVSRNDYRQCLVVSDMACRVISTFLLLFEYVRCPACVAGGSPGVLYHTEGCSFLTTAAEVVNIAKYACVPLRSGIAK